MSRLTVRKNKSSLNSPTVYITVLGCFAILLVVGYMYFLSMSVVHVVFRKEAHIQMRVMESEIASLEASYIEAQHRVSERIASAEQLTETSEKIFVRRDSGALVLTQRSN